MPPRPPVTLAVRRLGLTGYDAALEAQNSAAEACRDGGPAQLLLLEHPPTYTIGARGKHEHMLAGEETLARIGAAVRLADRGGDVTFHGPEQLVGYPILDLRRWGEGPVWYVRSLEETLLLTLAELGLEGERVDGSPGVWCGGAKIASIGVHVSRGITTHGFALNVNVDLSYFEHIVPCGLAGVDVTSMKRLLGRTIDMDGVMAACESSFRDVFGVRAEAPAKVTKNDRGRPEGLPYEPRRLPYGPRPAVARAGGRPPLRARAALRTSEP
jgi:lipoyl(octanoyl) transferase